MMNKKGQTLSEALLIGGRLVIIVAITFVIVSSVGSVFSMKQDVRPAEVMVLARMAAECLAPKGIAAANLDSEKCLALKGNDYFLNATLSSFDSKLSKNQNIGPSNIKIDCNVASKIRGFGNAPVCAESKNYVLIDTGAGIEKGVLIIEAGIRKSEQNV